MRTTPALHRWTLPLAGLTAVACGQAAEEEVGSRSPPGAAVPESLDTGRISGPGVPEGAQAAVVLYLSGFEEEGILQEGLRNVRGPGSYAVRGDIWTDARAVMDLLAPDTSIAVAGTLLVVGEDTTDVAVRLHGGIPYARVKPLARRFGALFYLHEPPDARVRQRSGSIWPRDLLCEFGQTGDPEAPVFQQAREEGLFAACDPDPSARTRAPGWQ